MVTCIEREELAIRRTAACIDTLSFVQREIAAPLTIIIELGEVVLAVVIVVALRIHLQQAIHVHKGRLAGRGLLVEQIRQRIRTDVTGTAECGVPIITKLCGNDALPWRGTFCPVIHRAAVDIIFVCIVSHTSAEFQHVTGIDAFVRIIRRITLIISKTIIVNPVVEHVDRGASRGDTLHGVIRIIDS